jgi:hypothetical protein
MTLRERCKEMYQRMQRDAMLRQGYPVDDLMAFVIAETGRTADRRLEKSLPLVCYFVNNQDRDEFIAAVRAVKPNMITKRMP